MHVPDAPSPLRSTFSRSPSADDAPRTLELSRQVRASLPIGLAIDLDAPRHNTFAGWPPPTGLCAFVDLEIRCRGVADPETGYLVGIGEIDRAVREDGLGFLHAGFAEQARRGRPVEPAVLLAALARRLDPPLDGLLHAVRWHLTPTCTLEVRSRDMSAFVMSQQFDFAAAHRLRCRGRDDDENRALFGKCMNDHGHNYRVQVDVEVPMPPDDAAAVLQVADLDRIVHEHVVEPFDHRNLNDDVRDFSDRLPSVEHIARTCHERLVAPFEAAGVRLRRVTVWETAKTACTYPADG